MNVKLELPEVSDLKPRITVIGIGGAGCNAINNMIASGLEGVEFVAANTDAQALAMSSAESRIQLGVELTEGLGAGARPEIGREAAEEAIEEIRSHISGRHMVFLAAGMGGGTGTGAVSVIARAAREMGILTVAIVSKPFQFEGSRRMRTAEDGIGELRDFVDTLIIIPNQNLFRVANEKTTFAEAFVLADQVLYSGIACIVDLIIKDGLINLDFADVKSVMKGMGPAVMGTGEASGEDRARLAAEQAISNPLLDEITLRGARGLLVSIIGDQNLTLFEVDEAANRVKAEADPEANIIVGASFESGMEDKLRVSIVAAGLDHADAALAGSPRGGHQANFTAPTEAPPTVAAPGHDEPTVPGPPPLPTPAPGTSDPSDPYLGDTSAETFARALEDVIGHVEEDSVTEPIEQGDGAWQTTDGVVIRDGLDHSFHTRPPPLHAAHQTMPPAENRPFEPQQPEALPRRVPDATDHGGVESANYVKALDGSGQRPNSGEGEHRRGLLRRIAGFGRQAAALADNSQTDSQSADPKVQPQNTRASDGPRSARRK
ncbi:MAG: cell division protein FtsZ [Hyphomicrobiaceae bacterium]